MSDECGTMNAGHKNAGLVETTMTADSLRLAARNIGSPEDIVSDSGRYRVLDTPDSVTTMSAMKIGAARPLRT